MSTAMGNTAVIAIAVGTTVGTIVVVGTLVIATLLFLDKKKKRKKERKQAVTPRDQAHGPGHHYTASMNTNGLPWSVRRI